MLPNNGGGAGSPSTPPASRWRSPGRGSWVPKPVEEIRGFNARYIALLAETAPEIAPGKGLSKGDAKPADSVSMIFDQAVAFAELPEHLRPRRFAHELGRGRDWRANYVAVTFAGWAVGLAAHRAEIEADLEGTPYEVHGKPPNAKRPNPGLVLSRRTPPVDNRDDFDAQVDALREGILAARELRRWLIAHADMLETWSRRLGASQGPG